uniref:Ubiquitin carboxyl-terminal hydrolase n=1 Tax=Babesia bovis TaxID=5865 RepID=A7APY2_BABBO|eukprot:XP_001612184.1 ubiquitin carboxyl-terminal hydrolase, family 1 protein [Babesia bovis T2Bo]
MVSKLLRKFNKLQIQGVRNMRGDFAPLEACPEVFNNYAEKLGQSNVVFQDLLAWEDWAYNELTKPVVGVIVTIPLTPKVIKYLVLDNVSQICRYRDTDAKYTSPKNVSAKVWFARQNLRNTCGTVALLHLLNNIEDDASVNEDSILEQMRKQSLKASPAERGALIEKTDKIKDLHTSFESQGQSAYNSDDVDTICHYITFVIVDDDLYELVGTMSSVKYTTQDGTLRFPVNHGRTEPKDLLRRVEKVVQGSIFALEPDNLQCAAIVASIKPDNEE